jgi:hypothetical protein
MIHRLLIIAGFIFGIPLSGLAQSNMEDVVYLKNGGVTRGTILEMIPDSTVKIQTADKNIFVYKFRDIEKIVKEAVVIQAPVYSQPVVTYTRPPKPVFKESGFHNITKFGPLGFSNYTVNMINGYQFNPYLLLGLGVGLDVYKGLGNNEDIILGTSNGTNTGPFSTDYFLPVYLDFRYHVSKSRATFLVFLNMGYSFYLGGNKKGDVNIANLGNNNGGYSYNYYYYKPYQGGTFFCPGIGTKIFITKTVGLLFDFGIKFQTYGKTQYYYNGYSGSGNYSLLQTQSVGLTLNPMLNFGVAF